MYTLYSRVGCHLCENAEALLLRAGLKFIVVDIADDDVAMKLYAFEIPVLVDESGQVFMKAPITESMVQDLLLQS